MSDDLCCFVSSLNLNLRLLCRVAVEGCPSTALSKPCVRLSPHTAFQLSVAVYALGDITTFTLFPIHKSLTSIDFMFSQDLNL